MNKRKTGTEWEKAAADYLTEQGVQIIKTNFQCRQGEIDLIGYHQGYLVFVEVKYRSGQEMGHALEAVDTRKQRKICRVADYYRYLHGIGDDMGIRYDVIGIQAEKGYSADKEEPVGKGYSAEDIEWIQNAFPHIYNERAAGWK